MSSTKHHNDDVSQHERFRATTKFSIDMQYINRLT